MTTTMAFELGPDVAVERAVRSYLGEVGAEVGVGSESCAVDLDSPISAYLALDQRAPQFPDRDLALLWHEQRGWSVAVESACGEDLRVIGDLGAPARPAPALVRRFLDRVLAGRS